MANLFKWTLLFVSIIGFSSTMMAQRGDKKQAREAIHQEIKTYAETEILPVMQPKREAFDQYLTAEEQAEIKAIRSELTVLKEETKAFRKSNSKPERGTEPTEEQREQMHGFHKRHRQLMTRAWAIADAHEAEIQGIMASVKDQSTVWREDIKQIIQANRPQHMEGEHPRQSGKGRGKKGHRGDMHGKGPMGMMAPFQSPVMFVLWDVDQPLENMTERPARNFPNPTESLNVLTYDVGETGMVDITLVNSQGVVVKQVWQAEQTAGSQRLEVDLSDLKTGVYTYRIKTPTGVQVQKVEVR